MKCVRWRNLTFYVNNDCLYSAVHFNNTLLFLQQTSDILDIQQTFVTKVTCTECMYKVQQKINDQKFKLCFGGLSIASLCTLSLDSPHI